LEFAADERPTRNASNDLHRADKLHNLVTIACGNLCRGPFSRGKIFKLRQSPRARFANQGQQANRKTVSTRFDCALVSIHNDRQRRALRQFAHTAGTFGGRAFN